MSEVDAIAIVRAAGGAELAERLAHLDATRAAPQPDLPLAPPDAGATLDTDVVFAGGGLSLLVAAALAETGTRVAVVERARAGVGHREWNASEPELDALVRGGITTRAQLAQLITARYARGVCKFDGGPPHYVTGVLDCAVDAGSLLEHTRALAVARGVRFLDESTVIGVGAGATSVRVRARARDGSETELTCRILVDARGSSSPYARGDLVCPTVGGVLTGLATGDAPDEVDPSTGEILVTNEPVDAGRQHLWEAFPGRASETTTYLFYYSATGHEGSLAELYARFFTRLALYKRGPAQLVRPTFGYIPAWSRLAPAPRSTAPRVVLVGDAASRHSPLTMCGFGAMLRSFESAARALEVAVATGAAPRSDRGSLAEDRPIHRVTGALALLMARPPSSNPHALNALLDAAFGTLATLGNDAFASLLRDDMTPSGLTRVLRAMSVRRTSVYTDVLGSLSPLALGRWGARLALEVARAR